MYFVFILNIRDCWIGWYLDAGLLFYIDTLEIKTLNKEFLDLEDFNENPTYSFKYLVGVKGLTSFFARPCIRHLLKCVCGDLPSFSLKDM